MLQISPSATLQENSVISSLDKLFSVISSQFEWQYKDRRWGATCGVSLNPGTLQQYTWIHYQSLLQRSFQFKCENEGVLVGMDSYYKDANNDRFYRFQCARFTNKRQSYCFSFPPTYAGENWSRETPKDWYLVGITSTYISYIWYVVQHVNNVQISQQKLICSKATLETVQKGVRSPERRCYC